MKVVSPRFHTSWTGGEEYIRSLNDVLLKMHQQGSVELVKFRNEPLFPEKISSILHMSKFDEILRRLYFSNLGVNVPAPLSPLSRRSLYWISDLQDVELPQMFDASEILLRRAKRENAINRKYGIYFSSQHAKNVFLTEHGAHRNLGILRFSPLPERIMNYDKSPLQCELCKYGGYFYFPSQWWKHKNHLETLKAFMLYRRNGGKLHLVLSGHEDDYRWPDLKEKIKRYVDSDKVNIHNLGFLNRESQLSVLVESRVLIQTSLYEGWSTTIEEALIAQKIVVASAIPVIREQSVNEKNVVLVDSTSHAEIALALGVAEGATAINRDREWRWERFQSDFLNLLALVSSRST